MLRPEASVIAESTRLKILIMALPGKDNDALQVRSAYY